MSEFILIVESLFFFLSNVEYLSGQQFMVSVIFSEKNPDTLISEERNANLLSPHLYRKY